MTKRINRPVIAETGETLLDPEQTLKIKKSIDAPAKRGEERPGLNGGKLSPNLKGCYPKGKPSLNRALAKELLEHPEKVRGIARRLINLALAGNMIAIQEIYDRLDGKVAEVHRIDSENPITLLLAPAQQLLNTQVIDVKPVELLDGAALHKLSSTEPEEIKSLEGAPS